MEEKKVQALIQLLDDPNHEVFIAVREKLLSIGKSVIPELEEAWEDNLSEFSQERIENIIHSIQFESTYRELKEWSEHGGNDILKGAYIISSYKYPDLDYNEIINPVEAIKNDVWLELNDELTALEKVKVLNHIIFDIHRFERVQTKVNSPRNIYINEVISSKKGGAVPLAIIYLTISRMLNLPIDGVNLPKNLILAYRDENGVFSQKETAGGVLFYINPFNRGTVFGRREITHFLKQQNLDDQAEYYKPCSDKVIIYRMLEELVGVYNQPVNKDKVDDLTRLMKLVENN